MITQEATVSLSLQEYAQRLVDSTLLSIDEVKSFVHRLADRHAADAVDVLATSLKQAGVLTDFQDQRVRSGHVKGLVLGNYLVLDEVGKGSSGMVFRARHRRMARIVALKLIPPVMLQNPTTAKRFHREVEAMSRVSHPNIVTAFDAGEDKGACFLILEYVDGYDLSVPIESGDFLPVADVVSYVVQAARGLHHVHSMGIVHRDVKPANLLLSKEGVVKILDMGLARLENASGNTNLTQTGSVMGTVDYMPPEQTLDSKTVDHRADIYSLGCSMYHLLTGHPVYDADNLVMKIIAHREQPIPSLREAREDVPARLDAIFQRMVAKDVEERYQSMDDVVDDLESLNRPRKSESAGPANSAESLREEADRTPADSPLHRFWRFLDTPQGFVVSLIAAFVITLSLLAAYLFWES